MGSRTSASTDVLGAHRALRSTRVILLGALWIIRIPTLSVVMLAVAAVLELAGDPGLPHAGAVAAVPLLLYGGAFALNDVLDSDADRRNSPWRPIPSGMLTSREALAIAVFCYGSGAALAVAQDASAVAYASAFVAGSIWYSLHAKHIVWLKNTLATLLSNSVFLYASRGDAPTAGAMYLAGGAVLLGLGREMLMDVHDLPGDRAVGRRTVAVIAGAGPASAAGSALCLAGVLWTFAPVAGWTFAELSLNVAWMVGVSSVLVLFSLGVAVVRGPPGRKMWLLAESIKVYMFLVLLGILLV